MSIRLTLTYVGGETETIAIRPLGMVAAERQFGAGVNNGHMIEATLYSAWFQKGKPTGLFEDWLATIDDIGEREVTPVVPLEEELSPDPLPT